jgi:hypothetical protein
VGTFRPPDVIAGLDGGAACVSHNNQEEDHGFTGNEPSRTFVRVWTTFCPLQAEQRASFLDDLTIAIGRQVPGQYSVMSSTDLGSTVALFPYAQGPFVGTVTLAADAAGGGYEIVITLEERLAR